MSHMDLDWDKIRRVYAKYLDFKPGYIGGGLRYGSIPLWMADREQAYSRFSPYFRSENLHDTKKVCEAYGRWLLASNNKSWTNLQRVGNRALEQPEKLCSLIGYLQEETVPIEERVQKGLAGGYKVDGVGKGILTGLLHTLFSEKHGVWNGSTEKAFRKLDVNIPGITSTTYGRTYFDVNEALNEMAVRLGASLTYVDGFMWYVATKLTSSLR